MPNPLQLIPAAVRRWVYIVYGVATLALTMAAAYFSSVGDPAPEALVGLAGALVPLGAALAAIAASNTTATNTAVTVAPGDVTLLSDSDAVDVDYEGKHSSELGAVSLGYMAFWTLIVVLVVVLVLSLT